MNKHRILAGLIILFIVVFSYGGCFRKEAPQATQGLDQIELVYYRLFDDEDVIRPIIQEYQTSHPNVKITYKKFTDLDEYENLIINELAEGEGPDILSVPNYWFLRNIKKLSPMPSDMLSNLQFEETFVSVAADDLILRDPADGYEKIYGIPLMVDTLALYYNRSTYEDIIPSRGRPAETWEELKDDVFRLTKKDNSFERFEVAGIAMGRADNISRAVDVLLMLMLQHKTDFYNDNISKADFAKQQSITQSGLNIKPAEEALDLYAGFALPTNKNYSWNAYISDPNSASKELDSFARGKVVMVFGYSYLYQQILDKIKELEGKGVNTIDVGDVRISPVPQVFDPNTSTEKRDAYASYFAETVSRTSAHPREAWDFLMFMSTKDNLEYYNQKTHRPTSRRDMIEDQKLDPIYGVYAEQIGYAESIPVYDYVKYVEIFSAAIDSVLATVPSADAIRTAEDEINKLLPADGLIPPAPKNEETS